MQAEIADFSGSHLQRLGYYTGGRPIEEHLFASAQQVWGPNPKTATQSLR